MTDTFSGKEVTNFIERIIELETRLTKLEAAAREALPHLTHDDYCDYIGKKLLTGDESTCNCAMGLAYDHLSAALEDSDVDAD